MSDPTLFSNQPKNELEFVSKQIGLGNFVFSLNKINEEIIAAEDNLFKVISLKGTEERENEDLENPVKCVLYADKKIFFNQNEELYMSEYPSVKEKTLLTKLTSQISQILFNKKYNYVICYDEDDNIHVVEISTKKVNQFKSENKCSIQFGAISKNENYLFLVGTDGQLTIYNFNQIENSNTAISIKKVELHFFGKKNNENISFKGGIDTNNTEILIAGGEFLLRTLSLSDFKIESLPDFNSKNEINIVKFLTDEIILISDFKNIIKIYNFKNKKLLLELDASKENNEKPINNFEYIIKEDENKKNTLNLQIMYANDDGNLRISNSIFLPKSNGEADEDNLDEILAEMNKEEKKNEEKNSEKENKEKSEKNSVKENKEKPEKNSEKKENEDLLSQPDLDDLEDSQGNLLGKDEIKKRLKEKEDKKIKQQAVENVENIDIDTLKEKLGLTDIQEPFISGSSIGLDNYKSRYILCNLIGRIILKESNDIKAVDVQFSDYSDKRNISFVNGEDFQIGALNEIGMLLANKIEEENLDQYENENKRKNALLIFKPIQNNTVKFLNDWRISLPQEENPVLLAIGSDWCCAYTSMSYLRIYSIYGSEKINLSLSNNVIAISGYENYLAYVYISSLPLSNSQQLRFKILDGYKIFNEVYDGILSISPLSNLIYFSYSKEGILISYDSYNIVRGFFYEVQNNWIPLLDLGTKYMDLNKNFWCVGVEGNEIFGIEMDGDKIEPPVMRTPRFKTFNLITEDKETEFQKNYFFVSFIEKQTLKFNEIKNLRINNMNLPDYKLCESFQGLSEIKTEKVNHDKKIISYMNDLLVDGKDAQVIVLFDYIFLNKDKGVFLKICRELKKNELANYLEYKLNINDLMQKKNLSEGGTVVQYISDNTAVKNKKRKESNNDEDSVSKNNLKDFAIDINEYQQRCKGIRKELSEEGLINNDKLLQVIEEKNDNNNINDGLNAVQSGDLFKNNENSKGVDLFSNLKKFASSSPIKSGKKASSSHQNMQPKIKPQKRTHKDATNNSVDKMPKKGNKKTK